MWQKRTVLPSGYKKGVGILANQSWSEHSLGYTVIFIQCSIFALYFSIKNGLKIITKVPFF